MVATPVKALNSEDPTNDIAVMKKRVKKIGEPGHQSQYLLHAKQAHYHLSQLPYNWLTTEQKYTFLCQQYFKLLHIQQLGNIQCIMLCTYFTLFITKYSRTVTILYFKGHRD